jgi:acetyltransferase
MADYPAHLVHEHRLFDGRTVTIRPVRPEDAQREREFLAGLSAENRYLRFQKWINLPSEKLAQYLADIDYDRHMAFVCTAGPGEDAPIVGDVRYNVNADDASCEFGVMISDAWHNTGIAGLLMDDLIGAARRRGLKRIEGLVLAANLSMLHFARGLGFTVSAIPEELTTMQIVKEL